MPGRRRVLFVCVHNSARSQIAEEMLRSWAGDRFEVHSAGTEARGVRPEAIAVMSEIGLDISTQQSKSLDRYAGEAWDDLITVCHEAAEACPYVPGAKAIEHWSFDDPSAAEGDDATRLVVFRRVRDEIATVVRDFITRAA